MPKPVFTLVAALLLVVSPGSSRAVTAPQSTIPHDKLLSEARRAANLSGKTIVERFVLADTTHWIRDDIHLLPGDIRILETKGMPSSWRRKLARLLLRDSLFTGLATLNPADPGPHVAVRFEDYVGALELRLFFASCRAQVILGGSPLGVVKMASVAEDVLALVRDAFPGDSTWAVLPPSVPPRWWGHPSLYLSDTVRVEYPMVTHKVQPSYPPVAVANDLQGTVWIRARISEAGRVTDAYVLRSIPLLDVAAIDAIRQWSFAPARIDGEPRTVWVQIPVRFALN